MEVSTALLGLAGIGQLASAIGVFMVVWRGGRVIGHLEGTIEHLSDGLQRVATMLDALEIRVGHLEGRK
jgi:hypothetical protein